MPLVLSLTGVLLLGLSVSLHADSPTPPKVEYKLTDGEMDTIAQSVVLLLKTRNTGEFVTNLAVKAGDWKSIITTNLSQEDTDRINNFSKGESYNARRLEAEANAFLLLADSLHIKFSEGDIAFKVDAPEHSEKIYLSEVSNEKLALPYFTKLDIVLKPSGAASLTNSGDFIVTVRGLEKFPTGWRISQGLQWTSVPKNLVDAKTLHQMAILKKIAAHQPVTSEDDPTLMKFGESLVQFVRNQDTNYFKKEFLFDSETIWTILQKSGQSGPSRKELNEEVDKQVQERINNAGKLVEFMKVSDIDLKTADIKITSASLNQCQAQGGAGTADNLIGTQFILTLDIRSDAKSKNGTSLSGPYVLSVNQMMKFDQNWKLAGDIQWKNTPHGVVDAEMVKKMEFENYVAKYRALPMGTPAPEIHFTTIVGDKPMKLSDFKGKVVILDFWATWCGPCQGPMAELQKIRTNHADWQDKVVIIPVSIDDTMDTVRKHLDQHGWTNTFNVWAGEGGWRSEPAKTFRVTGVPTSYVIDSKGVITYSGHPFPSNIIQAVDLSLKK